MPRIACSRSIMLPITILLLATSSVSADPHTKTSLYQLLFEPQLLIQHRDKLHLSDEDVARIHKQMKLDYEKRHQLQQQLKTAMAELVEELSAEQVDQATAHRRLDRILTLEKEIKHYHMRLLIELRNDLTPEQREIATKLRNSRREGSKSDVQKRLNAKLSRIEREIQMRKKHNIPVTTEIGLLQKFPELVKRGQLREAEALLEKVSDSLSDRSVMAAHLQLAQKLRLLQARIHSIKKSGRDVSELSGLLEHAEKLQQAGRLEEAKKVVEKGFLMTRTK